jgi:hypothetical protein
MRWSLLRGCLVVGLVGLSTPAGVQADLFDTARQAMRTDLGQADTSGVTIRGGASLTTGVPQSTTTLFRGQAQVGGGCGAADFVASFKEAFTELPSALEGLLGQVVDGLPMLALCYASPTLCDLAKHWQALINTVLQAKYAQCQQIQMAMAYSGLRLRGGNTSQCLEYQVNMGISITKAMENCSGSITDLRNPAGGQAPHVNLVQETLGAAGASTETQTLARTLLGEVTLSAQGGKLGAQHERPYTALLQRYEANRQAADTALRTAMQELTSTGTVSDATLRAVSVPGQALPRAALDALRTLQHDPVRFESLLAKLSTGLAITQLTWECQDLQEQLSASTDANMHLTDEQRRLLEKRLEGLQRDLAQVAAKKEVLERHLQPALDALLHEYSAVQQAATQAGLRAPSNVAAPMPYRGGQQPSGYSQ